MWERRPAALVVAAAAVQAFSEFVGLPECQLRSPSRSLYRHGSKSNASTVAISKAPEDVVQAERYQFPPCATGY